MLDARRPTRRMLRVLPIALALACGETIRPDRDAAAPHDAASPDAAISDRDAAPHDGASPDASIVERGRTLAVSATHACALRDAGLYCWGSNFAGQLGTGDTQDSEVPVLASSAGLRIAEVAATTGRTCVLRETGEVGCWGDNDQGQLGDGSRTSNLTAVAATGIDDARQLALDETSTCVLRAGGGVACWGNSPESEPDDGSLVPMAIAGVSDAVEVRAGALGSYCARTEAGEVLCWRLAEGAWTPPAHVAPLAGARAIAMTGHDEVCAIDAQSEVVCHNLDSGSTIPLASSAGSVELVGGELAACARDGMGAWRCWNVLPPMLETIGSFALAVPSDVPLIELAVSGFHACALRADGQVACLNANAGDIAMPPALAVVTGLPP